MSDVIIALLPALAWGVFVFGTRALVLTVLSVGGAVAAQTIYCSITKTCQKDISAVITGIIVALLCPVTVPLWLPPLGSAFGIIVGKMIFGGVGRNVFNPAATGVAFLHVAFSERMNTFVAPFSKLPALELAPKIAEGVETPLDMLKFGLMDVSNIWEKIYGMIAGNIGEISTVMIVLGFIYLVVRKTVKLDKTLAYICGMIFFGALYCYLVALPEPFEYASAQLFSGSTIFVAVFLCNDYTTTPTTPNGRIFFGVICSLLTVVFRAFCDIPDGAVFAVLIVNVLTPWLEKTTRAPYFGQLFRITKEEKASEK